MISSSVLNMDSVQSIFTSPLTSLTFGFSRLFNKSKTSLLYISMYEHLMIIEISKNTENT